MGKIFKFAASLCAVFITIGCSNVDERASILKVYNWADYIDEDLLGEFEEWYKEQTGEEVTVIYQLFDINEIMLAKIERGKEDFDVVFVNQLSPVMMAKAGATYKKKHKKN